MRLGTAVHMAVLEPERFAESYAEGPMASRSTRAWKDAQSATKALLLPPDEFRVIDGIVASLREEGSASQKALFDSVGENEATFVTKDSATGIEIKCRADRVTEKDCVIDLKTTQDASARAFGKSVYNFDYHVQAAFYMRCIEQATGVKPKSFVFVAVEKEAPYACQAFQADEQMLEHGARIVDRLLNQLQHLNAEYGTTKQWPSYNNQVQLLSLPAWALRDPN